MEDTFALIQFNSNFVEVTVNTNVIITENIVDIH